MTEEDLRKSYLNTYVDDIIITYTLSKYFNKITTFKVGDKFSIQSMEGYHKRMTTNTTLIQYKDDKNRQCHVFTNEQKPMQQSKNNNNEKYENVVNKSNTSYAKKSQNIHQDYNGGIIIGEEFGDSLNGRLAEVAVNTYNGISKAADLFDDFITLIS